MCIRLSEIVIEIDVCVIKLGDRLEHSGTMKINVVDDLKMGNLMAYES